MKSPRLAKPRRGDIVAIGLALLLLFSSSTLLVQEDLSHLILGSAPRWNATLSVMAIPFASGSASHLERKFGTL
jgi:hypothetical protein